MVTDPIADMITRMRNGASVSKTSVDIPASKMKLNIADILLKEGYIKGYKVVKDDRQGMLRVNLKYYKNRSVITRIERVSKPGGRVYKGADEIPVVRGGLGVAVLSTSHGVMSDQSAREKNIGGEVLIRVW
ncbi:MAG: 30S ribosomal protein S8 [Thermodesulfobacteriota bacterium]|nr:30S ribosomal protein S8 [Thermodesulfobacteriota bacterium]